VSEGEVEDEEDNGEDAGEGEVKGGEEEDLHQQRDGEEDVGVDSDVGMGVYDIAATSRRQDIRDSAHGKPLPGRLEVIDGDYVMSTGERESDVSRGSAHGQQLSSSSAIFSTPPPTSPPASTILAQQLQPQQQPLSQTPRISSLKSKTIPSTRSSPYSAVPIHDNDEEEEGGKAETELETDDTLLSVPKSAENGRSGGAFSSLYQSFVQFSLPGSGSGGKNNGSTARMRRPRWVSKEEKSVLM